MPRFREVSTNPGMSALMACTPFGRAHRNAAAFWVSSAVTQKKCPCPASAASMANPGSFVASSILTSASTIRRISTNFSRFPSSITRTAAVSLGMALSASPPSISRMQTGTCSVSLCSSLPNRQFAFPLSL